jgi:hypothetical protein
VLVRFYHIARVCLSAAAIAQKAPNPTTARLQAAFGRLFAAITVLVPIRLDTRRSNNLKPVLGTSTSAKPRQNWSATAVCRVRIKPTRRRGSLDRRSRILALVLHKLAVSLHFGVYNFVRKVNGVDTVRLTWSGATSSQVDIYRCVQQLNGCNPAVIATAPNDGGYIDSTGYTGPADVRYRVCETGTQTCSKTAGVIFRH